MNEQEMVREFHKKFGCGAPDKPTLDGYPFALRVNLILEEALEFADASGVRVSLDERGPVEVDRLDIETLWPIDWPKMVDGLIDLLYVTYGSLVEMGVDGRPMFAAVHAANMLKHSEKRADGKITKPEGWQPPNIAHLLELQKRGELPVEDEVEQLRASNRALTAARDENAAMIEQLREKLWAAQQRIRELGGCADE